MILKTFTHSPSKGWSADPLPPLDSESTLVIAFGAPAYIDLPDPFEDLVRAYPRSCIVGCSTSGEIFGDLLSDGTLSVAVTRFDQTRVDTAFAEIDSPASSRDVGERLARKLDQPDLKSMIVLSDGLKVNGSELVRGVNDVVSEQVVVTGGLAGDGDRFRNTWVLHGSKRVSGLIAAVGLYGDHVRVGHGSKGGWDIFGPDRVVTRSRGNVLYELDGRPALELYKEYLGERASGLPATALLFPLALRNKDDGTILVRTILSVDEDAQSMTFAGDLPQGSTAQLMKANFDRLIDGASQAALHTLEHNDAADGDILAIAISCVGRRLILGERSEEEIEAVLDVLPAGTQQIGFYSYGEISPYASGRCDLHNQTMTLTTVSES